MTEKRYIWLTLLTTLIVAGSGYLAGCVHSHPPYPPHLPRTVWLDDPYYFYGGYYYYYHDHLWHYSHERNGPWYTLPRRCYPDNVHFRDTNEEPRRHERAARPIPPGHTPVIPRRTPAPPGHTIENPGRDNDHRDKPGRGRNKRGPDRPIRGPH